MEINDAEVRAAEARMESIREGGYAVRARFDRRRSRVVVTLNTGVEIAIPTGVSEDLADATLDDLSEIEISPAGLGLHWPRLDADLYVPALMRGVLGSKQWMARVLGAQGGRARTPAKLAASRENGRSGGRPRKIAAG